MAEEYIERDALINEINLQRKSSKTSYPKRSFVVGDVLTCIYTAPAADVVEVVHGRWEYLQDDERRCSNCHTVFNTGGKWIPMTDNFCSECGADMRERRGNE